ncbi:MAG: hypothetical protein IPN15_18015 [Saprospiraceae bacterium]|nr:hypothetical protein [Candidatus Vicinibacter affinis]
MASGKVQNCRKRHGYDRPVLRIRLADGGVSSEFDTKRIPLNIKYKPGTELKLKGICTGKLMDVVLSL